MAILDQDQLSELQLRVIEPDNQGATWPSGLWTKQEIIDYWNQRQNRFNRDSKLLLAQATIPAVIGQVRYADAMPPDWIATQRVTYRDVAGIFHPMEISDAWAIDHLPAGRTPATPLIFDETTPPLMSFDLAPAATSAGRIDILYVSLLEVIDGTGQLIDTPDDFVPYLTYGVLSDMFTKIGRAQNLELATYFQARYEEGVALAKILLEGRF